MTGHRLITSLFIILSFSLTVATTVRKPSPNICKLDVYLVDKWGDSWNGAKLSVIPDSDATEDIMLKQYFYSPKSNAGGTHSKVSLLPSTTYTFSITSKGNTVPKEYWEIMWSFSTEGQTYIGDYSTTLSVFCLWQSPTDYVVQVKSSSGLITPSCETCTHPKPPPKSADMTSSISDVQSSTSDVQSSTSDVQSSTSDVQSSSSDVQSSTSDVQSSTSDVQSSASDVQSSSSDTISSQETDSTSTSTEAGSGSAGGSTASESDTTTSDSSSTGTSDSAMAPADSASSAASEDSVTADVVSESETSSSDTTASSSSDTSSSEDVAAAATSSSSSSSSSRGSADDDYSFGTRTKRVLDLSDLTPVKPKPAPLPSPPSPYPLLLVNIDGSGWFDGSGHSMYYSISDADRTTLIASGTMCGKISEELCEEKLRDGDYVLRVGGNDISSSSSSTWTFCGVTGGAQQELEFSVKKGVCTAGIMDKYTDYSVAQSVSEEEAETEAEATEQVELADQDTSNFQQMAPGSGSASSSYPLLMMVVSVSGGLVVLLGIAVFGVYRAVASKQKYNSISATESTTTSTATTAMSILGSGSGTTTTVASAAVAVSGKDIESVLEAEVSSSRHPLL